MTKKSDKNHFFIHSLKTAKENDRIYDPFGIANADDVALTLSIQKIGIQEPLTISKDGYVLSGHRRLAAATYLGMAKVPVRIIDVVFESLNSEERLSLLRTHNYQRDKTPYERIREELVTIDPNKALFDLKRNRLAVKALLTTNIEMGSRKSRPRITTTQFLEAVQRIIEENEEYLPLTDRRVHYLLLNDPPLKHDKKPDSTYRNDKNSYKALTGLLIRARLSGEIPMDSIEDTTRPIQPGGGFASPEQFVKQVTQNFLRGYSRDLQQGQPHHLEILLEKNALRSVIESVGREFCIPVTTGRGYASLGPRQDMAERFRMSGKKRLVLLMLTDFDPDGEQIASSFARSMRDDFGISVHPVKVALNQEDVLLNNLPSDMDAKPSSPHYKKFVAKYGTRAVELDAAPVKLLQDKLRDVINSYLDVDVFNTQIEEEAKDAALLNGKE
jgi:hypothetical protein